MSYENERAAIEGRFKTLFLEAADLSNGNVQVAYEGLNFDRPPADVTWIAVILLGGDTNRISLGTNAVFRGHGIAQFNINVPSQLGSKPARVIADKLEEIFGDVDLSLGDGEVLRIKSGMLKPLGIRDGKYVLIISFPFVHDTLK